MIAVIDYGAGNLRSVQKAFEYMGFDAKITSNPYEIEDASHIVLPGQGAFSDCMQGLRDYGLFDVVVKSVEKGKPFLGICVGMQLLFEKSYEFGEHEGFSFLEGEVIKFPDYLPEKGLKIPHMGWNRVYFKTKHPVFDNIESGTFFYFVHSYYAPLTKNTVGQSHYGIDFSAAVAKDNVVATQFHPEKSHDNGLKIIKNFGEWQC